MTRARNLSKLSNPATFTVDTDNNVGVNTTSPVEKLNVVGVVSATSFFGDGTGLTGEPASVDIHQDVVLRTETKGLEGSFYRCNVGGVVVQIVVTGTTIDGDRAVAGDEAHTGDGGLAATSSPVDDGIAAHWADAEGLS